VAAVLPDTTDTFKPVEPVIEATTPEPIIKTIAIEQPALVYEEPVAEPVEHIVIEEIEDLQSPAIEETVIETPVISVVEELSFVTETQPIAATVAEKIVEDLQLETNPEVTEQITYFVEAVPETVQEKLVTFMETAEPEQVIAMETLVVTIAQAAGRLHELVMTEQAGGQEAQIIEELISEWYTELLQTIGIEPEEKLIAEFIQKIKSESYVPAQKTLWLDETPNEITDLDDQTANDQHTLHSKLGWTILTMINTLNQQAA
jgi:hypothetical protein